MMKPRTLEGKVAIVTGASRGIGKVLAFDLASRGAKVTIAYTSDRSEAPVKELIARITDEAKSTAIAVKCDLETIEGPSKIVNETLAAFGKEIDILVNNAAIISGARVGQITPEHFDQVFAVNVRAPLLMTQAVLPHLRRPGRIINISSVGSRAGHPSTGVYAASKAALEAFTRNWATELGKDGTTVNAVNPGPVESEMLAQVDPKLIKLQTEATPVQNRPSLPEEIAEIVGFLAEPRSSWISGQCISASGGHVMY